MGNLQRSSDNGHLLRAICWVNDPSKNGHLIQDCDCCDCSPPVKETYQSAVTHLPNPPALPFPTSGTNSSCNRWITQTPNTLTYRATSSIWDCTWQSPDISGYGSIAIGQVIQLRWQIIGGFWEVQFYAWQPPAVHIICPVHVMVDYPWILRPPTPLTNHCTPVGSYSKTVHTAGVGSPTTTLTCVIS